MTSAQIRQSFLDFFKEKQHSIVPSSSLMPDSPNLLFTNAGMNQFVPIFLAKVPCPYSPPRAADTQKCIRAGGKHNDLEDVGLDTYHHTFFEMLGNWSFGDYFKKEAITWAWELVVERWKFPANRLYATVYSPDKSKGDPADFDQEAWDIWAGLFKNAGLDPKIHIVNGNKKDNFWMMGDTGPCGPCSELHVDLTPKGDTKGSLVNQGDARCIEIWNLVFIQFNANPDGSFSPLPAKHVDTGMGFERVCSIIQGTKNFSDFKNARISNYDTDVFAPIFRELEQLSGRKYTSTLPKAGSSGDTEQEKIDVAFRVIADHIRTLSFSIADGIQPGNNDRNYVLRRILRRAVRYGRTLGFHEPFFYKLVGVLAQHMGSVFPELRAKQKHIEDVLRMEEEAFNRTLDIGISIFQNAVNSLKSFDPRGVVLTVADDDANVGQVVPGKKTNVYTISGDLAFKLYDTYGFPLDLTELMAREQGLVVDVDGYNSLMEEQRTRARAAQKKEIIGGRHSSAFTSQRLYSDDQTESLYELETRILGTTVQDGLGVLFFIPEETPFYVEMGGQQGDTGEIFFNGTSYPIKNVEKIATGAIFHDLKVPCSDLDIGCEVVIRIDKNRRSLIEAHHSGTHIMHWALRKVLGDTVGQKGSYVGPDRLRFDFSHGEAMKPEQIREVERLVNEKVAANDPVQWNEKPYAEVKGDSSILQFFGEKYGERVRVVDIGGYSKELCGGTHVRNTSEIGTFRIVSESAIAAGVRRIEAISGEALRPYLKERLQHQEERHTQLLVKLPASASSEKWTTLDFQKDLASLWDDYQVRDLQISTLENQIKELEKEQAKLRTAELQRKAAELAPQWAAQAKTVGAVPLLTLDIGEGDSALLQAAMGELKKHFKGVAVLAATSAGKVSVIASVSPDFTAKVQAGKIIQAIAPLVGGKGGGKPDLAQGGGTQPEKISEALARVKTLL